MAGLYIHIPFCASRCIYCGFYSTTLNGFRDKYIDAICKEMKMRGDQAINTIYIGGGTPSQLSKEELDKIFLFIKKTYDISDLKEITIECNPDDITPELAKTIASHANRISMGAQTFSDKRLKFLHRRHNAEEVRTAVKNFRIAGIKNISIDLMFGFPDETLDEWNTDIKNAIALNIEHISAYSLMYEEGTALYKMLKQNKIRQITDEQSFNMYDLLIDKLKSAGFEHYEISNFAKPGFRSIHNSSYWQGIPYIGIGAAAHSFDINTRSWNVANLQEYINTINKGQNPSEKEIIDEITEYNDLIVTALRTKDGICLTNLKDKYKNYLITNARRFINGGMMQIKNNHLSFKRKGLYISDSIMRDLIYII